VGVLTPLKGIHHLVNAFARIAMEFPHAQLIIIGKEESRPYAQTLRKQVLEFELRDRVCFLDVMPQTALAKYLAKSAVLVLPSLSEGLGRVIIEAMATGTPVIGSRVGGIPELIENEVNGFLVPCGDEQALAEKLRWTLNNPEKIRSMGESARKFAGQLFSTGGYLKGYNQIFEVVLPEIEQREHANSTFQSRNRFG
jgi:glycosyltransferase involved in cell wall biosynthesis